MGTGKGVRLTGLGIPHPLILAILNPNHRRPRRLGPFALSRVWRWEDDGCGGGYRWRGYTRGDRC